MSGSRRLLRHSDATRLLPELGPTDTRFEADAHMLAARVQASAHGPRSVQLRLCCLVAIALVYLLLAREPLTPRVSVITGAMLAGFASASVFGLDLRLLPEIPAARRQPLALVLGAGAVQHAIAMRKPPELRDDVAMLAGELAASTRSSRATPPAPPPPAARRPPPRHPAPRATLHAPAVDRRRSARPDPAPHPPRAACLPRRAPAPRDRTQRPRRCRGTHSAAPGRTA